MITDLEVKRAMNRLAAVYPSPRDPGATYDEWRSTLRDRKLNLTPSELDDAISRFIASTEKSYGYPTPGQITAIVRARREPQPYYEPDIGPRATPEDVRKAWEAAGIDLDELRAAHQRMKDRGRGGAA